MTISEKADYILKRFEGAENNHFEEIDQTLSKFIPDQIEQIQNLTNRSKIAFAIQSENYNPLIQKINALNSLILEMNQAQCDLSSQLSENLSFLENRLSQLETLRSELETLEIALQNIPDGQLSKFFEKTTKQTSFNIVAHRQKYL